MDGVAQSRRQRKGQGSSSRDADPCPAEPRYVAWPLPYQFLEFVFSKAEHGALSRGKDRADHDPRVGQNDCERVTVVSDLGAEFLETGAAEVDYLLGSATVQRG